jgi:sporulation protein YlmC with PRC-barrel domain
VFIGEVEDLQLDLSDNPVTGLALCSANDELFGNDVHRAHGVIIPYRWVEAVDDAIYVYNIVEQIKTPYKETELVIA